MNAFIHITIGNNFMLGYSQLTTRKPPSPPSLKSGLLEFFFQNVAQCFHTNENNLIQLTYSTGTSLANSTSLFSDSLVLEVVLCRNRPVVQAFKVI